MSDTVIPRSILKHSDDARAKAQAEEKELQERQSAYVRQQSKFSRYFGEHLPGDQITAAERLLREVEISRQSGAACASYDGMPVSAVTFGSKTPSERALEAFQHIRKCRTVIAEVLGPYPYDAYFYLETALIRDLSPQELGDMLIISAPVRFGQKRRRQIAVNIIDQATRAIMSV